MSVPVTGILCTRADMCVTGIADPRKKREVEQGRINPLHYIRRKDNPGQLTSFLPDRRRLFSITTFNIKDTSLLSKVSFAVYSLMFRAATGRRLLIGSTAAVALTGTYVTLNQRKPILAENPRLPDVSVFKKLPTREEMLERTKRGDVYDLVVVGGGATGTGCALDAASRGLKVALIERDDFAAGTSSRSTKLVHGGVRYLEKAFKVCALFSCPSLEPNSLGIGH